MNMLLVARDVAPSNALIQLRDALIKRERVHTANYAYFAYLGEGKPIAGSIEGILETFQGGFITCVVTGMSSSPELAAHELAAGKAAKERNIPLFLYADTYNCHERKWFAELIPDSTLFVINENEKEKVKEKFPTARVVAAGNPLWEDFFFPKMTREGVREALNIPEDEIMILCPGTKSLLVCMQSFSAAIEAASTLDKKVHVVVSLHPGDENNPLLYAELAKFSEIPVTITKRLSEKEARHAHCEPPFVVSPGAYKSSEMLPGADVVIETASTLGIEAACQRIPVIDYFTYHALNRIESTTGTRKWEVCNLNAAIDVYDIKKLARTLRMLVTDEDGYRRRLETWQEIVYPEPQERGAAIKNMLEAIFGSPLVPGHTVA